MRKIVHLATKLPSFDSARESVTETIEVELVTKRIERLTERIGCERVFERECATRVWEKLPLVEKLTAPKGVKAPQVVCVSCDGGRMRRCDLPDDAKSHWCETKVGVLLESPSSKVRGLTSPGSPAFSSVAAIVACGGHLALIANKESPGADAARLACFRFTRFPPDRTACQNAPAL